DRSDGMDHVAGRQPVTTGDAGFTGRAAAERGAFGPELRPGCTMNGAIDAAATEERAVGRVDDRIDSERRYVGKKDLDPRLARHFPSLANGRYNQRELPPPGSAQVPQAAE